MSGNVHKGKEMMVIQGKLMPIVEVAITATVIVKKNLFKFPSNLAGVSANTRAEVFMFFQPLVPETANYSGSHCLCLMDFWLC